MPLHAPMQELPGAHRHRRAVVLLSTACLSSTESVLYLVDGQRLWDAERVMRSVVEGTVKFGYLLESRDAFLAHAIEYTDTLPAVSRLAWHAKAEEALKSLCEGDDSTPRPYRDLLLDQEEAETIRSIYPRGMRKDIERRWGFTALVEAVSSTRGAFGPTARVMLHGYSVSSHLQHMSHEGTDMPLDREQRSAERREAMMLAHAAKLVADSFHFTYLRVAAILRFHSLDPRTLFAVEAKHKPLMDELDRAGVAWERGEYGAAANAAAA
jgi:hypothetical protein